MAPEVSGSGRYAYQYAIASAATRATAISVLIYFRSRSRYTLGIVLTMEESHYGLRIALFLVILAANAFFSAAEVALITVRKSRLKQLAEQGDKGARAALNLLANPERLLSVTQVGVTLASLGLGWAGEGTIYSLIMGVFQPLETPTLSRLLHGAS